MDFGYWPKEGTSERLNGGKKVRLVELFSWLFSAESQGESGYIPLLGL